MLLSRCTRVLRRAVAVSMVTLTAAAVSPGAAPAAWAAGPGPGAGAANGDVFAWGDNQFGAVGDGTNVNRTTPTRVCATYSQTPCAHFLALVTEVSAGQDRFSLGLVRDGSALSWGFNRYGQLGNGTTSDSDVPVRVCAVGQTAPCSRYLTGVHALAAGWDHGMALDRDTSVVAWGDNSHGQLGDGTLTERRTPVRVCALGQKAPCARFLDHIRQISPGGMHSLAVEDNGMVLAWGWNGDGQLGNGATEQSLAPVRVCAVGQTAPCTRYLTGVKSVAASLSTSTALLADGSVVSWGFNGNGEMGDGTFFSRPTPERVCAVGQTAPCTKYLTGVRAIASTSADTYALLSDGTVAAWGWNLGGELGNGEFGDPQPVPVRVCAVGDHAPCTHYLEGVRHIASGQGGGLAVIAGGTAVAWGGNDSGRLGDGTTTYSLTPVRVCAPGQTAPCHTLLGDIRGISGGSQSLAVLNGT